MREIKEYLTLKKKNNVIKLIIGGEIKHYPIISIDYDFIYDRSDIEQLLTSKINITITANAFNLKNKMINIIPLQDIFDIYYGNYKYLRCNIISYTKLNDDNSYKLKLVAEQLSIN